MSRRAVWMVVLGFAAAGLILAGVFGAQSGDGSRKTETTQPVVATGATIGGSFTLVGPAGESVTEAQFSNRYKLVFFGFTFCPSICPTELLKMADILTALGPQADRIAPLFVTIDPERDTPEVLAAYTAKFDPRIIGLTGTREQIDAVIKSFRVYAARVAQGADYTMDHSAFMYLMDRENALVTLYKIDQSANEIADDLKQRL